MNRPRPPLLFALCVRCRPGALFCCSPSSSLVCLGLGYPVLNRYDLRSAGGLTDVNVYSAMVVGQAPSSAGHMRFRVLVPALARPFYRLANHRLGS